jgi:hypothetical protein
MKLAAIYNVWDGVELLRGSMISVAAGVDLFIIVYQDVSNFGEKYDPLPDMDLTGFNVKLAKYTPRNHGGHVNEIKKRNLGIQVAKQEGCTHFFHRDVDEYYKDFVEAKEAFIKSEYTGSVCGIQAYFKQPDLMFDNYESYYVPFIHKLLPNVQAGARQYPFRVDPTRKITRQKNVIELPHTMHHFSWVRKDIQRKIRNSSARNNMRINAILNAYNSPQVGDGYYVQPFERLLVKTDNHFNIQI